MCSTPDIQTSITEHCFKTVDEGEKNKKQKEREHTSKKVKQKKKKYNIKNNNNRDHVYLLATNPLTFLPPLPRSPAFPHESSVKLKRLNKKKRTDLK